MTKEEINKAKLIVYMTDGKCDEYYPEDWNEYYVEDNYLKIINIIESAREFTVAIYNMNYVERVAICI